MTAKKGSVIIVGKNDDAPISYWITRGKSVLHNPYRKGVDGTKAEVIEMFKEHADLCMLDSESDFYKKIHEYADRVKKGDTIYLRCVCKPNACHGDYVKYLIDKVAFADEQLLSPEFDGITHINMYSRGKTTLGKMLTNMYDMPFNHPVYGQITSVEGLWHYLNTGKQYPQLLKMSCFDTKAFVKNKPKSYSMSQEEFRKEICGAITTKILFNDRLHRLFKESTLPLTHYYTVNKNVLVPPNCGWMIDFLEGLRKDLRSKESKKKSAFGNVEII